MISDKPVAEIQALIFYENKNSVEIQLKSPFSGLRDKFEKEKIKTEIGDSYLHGPNSKKGAGLGG